MMPRSRGTGLQSRQCQCESDRGLHRSSTPVDYRSCMGLAVGTFHIQRMIRASNTLTALVTKADVTGFVPVPGEFLQEDLVEERGIDHDGETCVMMAASDVLEYAAAILDHAKAELLSERAQAKGWKQI